ncbi:FAD-dependent monooxygenase [Paraburkholderia edwinii]|uniref:FAD-dependent monooxygenase n=1 Tax=Paraburkholderia edwinii TaxID=2861782 RepID=A0ABX8V3K5_9BURK|nr:FAD-dependent monooxygenase [Paraburkholderia edwinii]QYD73645.1 FAD-dependent monooxygenase [Paraburkholderia edwinii]
MDKRFAEQRAIVIGAGIGGLAVAAALANHFGQVVVLERDELPAEVRPRPGAAQTRHLHVLLSGGAAALAELFPGVHTRLIEAGAQLADVGADANFELAGTPKLPRRELNIYSWQLSRPLLEAVLREQLRERENVQLRELSRVIEIVPDENNRAAGVRVESREGKHDELDALLVIDASGRGVPTLDFLKATGRPLPTETTVGTDLTYGTTVYSFPDGAEPDFKQAWVHGKAPEQGRAGFLVKRENGLWDAVLAGRLGDVPPIEDDAFLAFADTLPNQAISTALRRGRREAPIVRFGYPESRWRHFADLTDFPVGLLPLGDAVCNTNPVFGQGMTVAAKEAVMLHRLLAESGGHASSLETIGPAFLKEMEDLVKTPWSGATALDLAYPQTKGERPADMRQRSEYQAGVMKLAAVDPDVHRLMVEVRHLVKPANLLHTPDLQQRVQAVLQHPAASS